MLPSHSKLLALSSLRFSHLISSLTAGFRPCLPHMCHQEAFRGFDKDGDGVISRQELAQVLKNGELNTAFGTHTIETILVDIDANRDGKISFDEFMQMMRGKAEEDSSDDELSTARSKSSLF